MPLSVFTIESITLILVIAKDSGTIVRKTGSPFVQFISREISQAISSLTFSTRNSILETRSSRLETRYSKLSRIKYRVLRIEARGTVNLLLSGTVNSQLVCLLPGGILNLVACICIWIFIIVCLQWSWLAPMRSGQLSFFMFFLNKILLDILWIWDVRERSVNW